MADDPPQPNTPTPSAETARPVTKAPLTEAEINSPDRRALAMLFVIFAVTAGSWGAGRFACNMHPPESRGAPKLSTDRLTATAKDAAIEFVQRWRSYDFTGALEIAGADVATEMTAANTDCLAKANECARQREASAGRLTTVVVLTQVGFDADVRATTELKGTKETYRLRVHRDESSGWKVYGKTAEPAGAVP
jgi:hypothetical protein